MLSKLRMQWPLHVDKIWYRPKFKLINYLLMPFAFLFGILVSIRRFFYKSQLYKTHSFSVPVIVVGNITVGGTGKTPFVLWLIRKLRERGFNPGVITRGVGGTKHKKPYQVRLNDMAEKIGDEAMMLANAGCPVVIGTNKVANVDYLLAHNECDVIISDDGLQHYRLGRDVEIVMIDGERQLGNQSLLPAGPLRESAKRLREADIVVMNGESKNTASNNMLLVPQAWVSVKNPKVTKPLDAFLGVEAYVVAGIGNPGRFFKQAIQLGVICFEHAFPDHHLYQANDFNFQDDLPILMTEKDAVKCQAFADDRFWYLKVTPMINSRVFDTVLTKLTKRKALC